MKKKVVGGQPAAVDAPSWKNPGSDVLENAAAGKHALFIFFPGESDDQQSDGYLAGKDYKDLDGRLAQFVRVPYTSDREGAPYTKDSIVPTSKILSDNPSRDYNVKAYPTFIIADSYGNEHFRLTGKKPLAKELEEYFNKVSSKTEDTQKKLQKNLDEAKKAWEAKDSAKAMKAIRGNFKDGVVGLDAQNETIRMYHEIVDSTRGEISTLAAEGSADSVKRLKAMKATFKGTEVEKNIDEALKASAGK